MLPFDFPLYLASSSLRRKEIMESLFPTFEIIEASVDETNHFDLPPEILTKRNSLKKLLCAKQRINATHYVVIAADTVVTYKDKIFGKPNSRDEAINMLNCLSNKTHQVITGVAICYANQSSDVYTIFSETSQVTFYPLVDKTITSYVDSQKPFDKAGAYGIQELPEGFVKQLQGNLDTIIGLPSIALIYNLERLIA